jgi:4-amino-4-deoxy-L-arabinose transferase-like glycosyltransferase
MLRRGRILIALVSVALGLVVFLWSRKLFGNLGGLVSLVLYAFSPSMLANAGLATTDLVTAACFLFALGSIWWVLHEVTPWSLAASGLALAGLLLSKLTGLFMLPILLILVGIRIRSREPAELRLPGRRRRVGDRPGKVRVFALVLAVQLVIVFACIWGAYGFRYGTFRYSQPGVDRLHMPHFGDSGRDPWEVQYEGHPLVKALVEAGRKGHLLPEPYLYTVALGSQVSGIRRAFLDGHYSLTGFRSFFPLAFLYKTPLPVLAILVCALAAFLVRRRGGGASPDPAAAGAGDMSPAARLKGALYRTAPLWLLLVVYWAVVLTSRINIGHRHLLPVYPPLFVLAGASAGLLAHPRRAVRAVVPVLGATMVAVSLAAYPHYLAFFNMAAGGSSNGYRHLVDSSLDWGQDLIGLRSWLARNAGHEPVYLSYFGFAPPRYYGITALSLPADGTLSFGDRHIGLSKLTPGTYCISATRLQQVYQPDLQEWTATKDSTYRELLPAMRELEALPVTDNAALVRAVNARDPGFREQFEAFQEYRFGKLCACLRRRKPDAQVGHSILVYRLTGEDLERALAVKERP